jgi:hypothetical protein
MATAQDFLNEKTRRAAISNALDFPDDQPPTKPAGPFWPFVLAGLIFINQ